MVKTHTFVSKVFYSSDATWNEIERRAIYGVTICLRPSWCKDWCERWCNLLLVKYYVIAQYVFPAL